MPGLRGGFVAEFSIPFVVNGTITAGAVAPRVLTMSSKCSGSFYDALGGKHASGQLFAVVVPESEEHGPTKNYTIVSGVPAGENEISVEDLAGLCSDERFKVSVHSHGWEGAPIPFDPENYQGRLARKSFDAEKARISLGNSYAPWLEECARNLPTAPEDSLDYSRKVATAFLANLSGTGLVSDLTNAPGVLAAGPQALLARFWGNSGMVDVAARVFVDRLTPPITAQEAALLHEYLGHATFDERNDLCLKVLERLGLWDSSIPISAPPLTGDEEVDEDPPSDLMDKLRARTWMLAIELGVPELAEMLGCSTDPKDSLYRLNIYDLAEAAGKRRPGYVAARESVDRRAADVALSVAQRHKMVTYSVDVGLLTQDGTQPHPGQPLLLDGEVQGSMRLVGVTAGGEVLTFQDADSLEPARRFSAAEKGLVSRYPSIEDAIRGSKGTILHYAERDANERSTIDKESGGMFEQALHNHYMEFIANSGEYEGERDDRARLLARLEFRGAPEPGIDGNAATGQQDATRSPATPAENQHTGSGKDPERLDPRYSEEATELTDEQVRDAFDSEFGWGQYGGAVLWHKASNLCEKEGGDPAKMERLLRFMLAHPMEFPGHTFRKVALTSCPVDAIESAIRTLESRVDVVGAVHGLRYGLEERAEKDEEARNAAAEQKDELKKRRESRATSAPPVADLRSMDLRGYDLSYLDLSGLHLSGLDMTAANLTGADLAGTDLSGTDLSGANLSGVDLRKTILNGTILNDADLTGADLRGIDVKNMQLKGANFSGANLAGADFSSDDSIDDSIDDSVEEFRDFLDGVDPDDFRDE